MRNSKKLIDMRIGMAQVWRNPTADRKRTDSQTGSLPDWDRFR
jgi:hypothetical protein